MLQRLAAPAMAVTSSRRSFERRKFSSATFARAASPPRAAARRRSRRRARCAQPPSSPSRRCSRVSAACSVCRRGPRSCSRQPPPWTCRARRPRRRPRQLRMLSTSRRHASMLLLLRDPLAFAEVSSVSASTRVRSSVWFFRRCSVAAADSSARSRASSAAISFSAARQRDGGRTRWRPWRAPRLPRSPSPRRGARRLCAWSRPPRGARSRRAPAAASSTPAFRRASRRFSSPRRWL